MALKCGKQCKHYAEEGWNELSMCMHDKVIDSNGRGKYIYEFSSKLMRPKWCPKNDEVLRNQMKYVARIRRGR